MDKPTEQKGKENPSPYQTSQPKKPAGSDTLFFESMKGNVIRCLYAAEHGAYIDGKLLDVDKYGLVIESSEWGLVYVFKHGLSAVLTPSDK